MDIKLSVIIPVYNAEEYLEQCLDSVANQTLREMEIICVDDESTDHSLEILRDYQKKDSRLVIIEQKNQGAGTARNNGIAAAKGEYLHFLDADDWMAENAYEVMYEKAKKNAVDVVKTRVYGIDAQNGEIIEKPFYNLSGVKEEEFDKVICFADAPETLAGKVAVVPWNGIYRREFLLENNIQYNSLKCVNDRSFYNHVLVKAKRVMLIPEATVYHRMNVATSLVGQRMKHFECHFESFKIIEKQCADLTNEQKKVVLSAELKDVFGWYKRYKDHNLYGKKIEKQFKEFLADLDPYFYYPDGISAENVKIWEKLMGIEIKKAGTGKSNSSKRSFLWRVKNYLLRKIGINGLKKRTDALEKTMKKVQSEMADTKKRCTALEKKNKKLVNENDRLMQRIYTLEKCYLMQHGGLNEKERSPRIIVSITSYPKRMCYIPAVLEQMLMQTVRPDKLILWLSKEQYPNREADIPEEILELKKYGLEIEWCDGDTKAYKKSIPALKQYPDDLIIIIDDDLTYELDFVEKLYKAHLMFPNDIIASRVHQIALDENMRVAPYAVWKRECDFDQYKTKDDWFFTGGAGTLFPPHIFKEEVFDQETFMELCPLADDIWLNIHAAINGVKIINAASNNHIVKIEEAQIDRLWNVNINQNDEQMMKVIDHYSEELRGTIYNMEA